jgi:hypothetical protein
MGRIGAPASSRQGVIGREHAADEGDRRESAGPVVADTVDIPPDIAIVADGGGEIQAFGQVGRTACLAPGVRVLLACLDVVDDRASLSGPIDSRMSILHDI